MGASMVDQSWNRGVPLQGVWFIELYCTSHHQSWRSDVCRRECDPRGHMDTDANESDLAPDFLFYSLLLLLVAGCLSVVL